MFTLARNFDICTDKLAPSYTHHVDSRWQQQGDKVIWEVRIDIYSDGYRDGASDNQPQTFAAGKVMGFMVAYCDNDGSELWENFMGSEFAAGNHKDRGWIDAGLFGTLKLVEHSHSAYCHTSCLTQSTSMTQSAVMGESLILAKFKMANKGSGNSSPPSTRR